MNGIRWVMDMMGGKPGCHYGNGEVCPTITKGRASANDVHVVMGYDSRKSGKAASDDEQGKTKGIR